MHCNKLVTQVETLHYPKVDRDEIHEIEVVPERVLLFILVLQGVL